MKKKKRKNLTTKWSNLYIAITLLFVFGFGFFFSSKVFMAEDLPINYSELGKEFDLRANGKLTISDWKYDEQKNKMEVILVTNGIKNYTNELNFTAIPRSNMKEELPISTVYNENDIYILQINKVPKDFQQIALRLSKVEINSEDLFEDKEKKEIDRNTLVSTLYTDQRVVKKEKINKKDYKIYAIEITNEMIQSSENKIKDLKETLRNIDSKNSIINTEIKKIEEEILYQTVDEQVESNNQIYNLKNVIEQNEREKEEINTNIDITEEKIEKLEQRKRDLEYQ